MAISYFTGTLNPASTTLAQDIRNAIKSAVTQAIAAGKTNWAIADDGYTVASNIRTVITNTAGFAMKIHHSSTLTNTTVGFTLGQSYTAATHTLTNIAFGGNTATSATPAANGWSGVNSVNVDTQPIPHNTQTWVAINTQTNWYASVEADYMIFSIKVNNTTGYWFYLGKFQSLVGNATLGTDTYPFTMVGSVGGGTNSTLGLSMNLNSFANAGIATNHIMQYGNDNAYAQAPAYGQAKDYYSLNYNKAKVSKANLYRANGSAVPANASTAGWLRGRMNNIIFAPATNAVIGTTFAIDTKTYQFIGGTAWAAIN